MPRTPEGGPSSEQALEIERRKKAYEEAVLEARREVNNIGTQPELEGKAPGARAVRKISKAELAKPDGVDNQRIQSMLARFRGLEQSYLSATHNWERDQRAATIRQHLDLWISLLEDPNQATGIRNKNIIETKKS